MGKRDDGKPPANHDGSSRGLSRRDFIKVTGAAVPAGVLVGEGLLHAEAAAAADVVGPGAVPITLRINGETRRLSVEPRVTLLDALRDRLNLTGAKKVCDRGTCGACTVLVDGKAIYACSTLAIDAQSRDIVTIEGLAPEGELHPVSAAFVDHDAQQCGFCTPGFVVATAAFLHRHPDPSYEEVKAGLGGNLCRCGTYVGVRKAALDAAQRMKGGLGLMADYQWPQADNRTLIGKRISRVDGPLKSSGRATYTYDVQRPGLLFGKMVLSPHAHARIVSIDTSQAERLPGVQAVDVIREAGQEVLWAGQEILAVAAETEEQARDAARAVKITYEKLPHLVSDVEPAQAGDRAEEEAEQVTGDPEAGFEEADATIEGRYGSPVITHCCLESHGQVAEWEGENLTVWASTQNVSGLVGQYAEGLQIPAGNVRTITPVMGGGFGSKFQADTWGLSCARLARKARRPVKMMLERDQELLVAGARPSIHARVRAGAKRDGTLTAWSSQAWGTGGITSRGSVNLPYIFQVPNRRSSYSRVSTNIGPARAWRAPRHPQMCLITMAALEDLAAELGMDALDFFLKNVGIVGARAETYRQELLKGAELMEWKKKWHPRGDKTSGPSKRGLGLALHTWGGGGHQSNCNCTIHPDGSVAVSLASQDLGTGTRTVIGIVAAETLGLPLDAVKVNIGDSRYPPSGASGGSTTVGGVSSSTRRAATAALNELLAKVAPSLGVEPDQLEAVGGRIQVIGNSSKSIAWKQACAKLGTTPITASGRRSRDLISSGVGGIQMAEVSVDIETGVVKMEKMVAVQDCGLIIDLKTAESQVHGACIMGVTYALYEEKLMDERTGRCLNPDLEFYKLAGIGDIGEIEVHTMTGPGYDDRGVIGLGEPPVISPGAAISNAVANAIGVRVPTLPLTPDKVLAALEKKKGGAA